MPFVAPVVAEFMALHPQIQIDLTMGERMVDLIDEGFDLAVRATPPPDSSLIIRRLASWRHVLCGAPSYLESHTPPLRPADLASHRCLRYAFYPFGDEWRFVDPEGQFASVRVMGNLVSNSAETLRLVALSGQGLFLAPSFIVADDLRSGRFLTLLADYLPIEFAINAVYPHRHQLSPKVRTFLDLLGERLKSHRIFMNPYGPDEAELPPASDRRAAALAGAGGDGVEQP